MTTDERLGLGFVRYNRGLGRKRVFMSNVEETSPSSSITTPLKRQCSAKMADFEGTASFESTFTTPLKTQCSAETNGWEETSSFQSSFTTPSKRQSTARMIVFDSDQSCHLEALPTDIITTIICGVNHEDLKQLFHVSKPVREATLRAKDSHFAFKTPSKTQVFKTTIDYEDPTETDEIEAPSAPKQTRSHKSRVTGKNLDSICTALFA